MPNTTLRSILGSISKAGHHWPAMRTEVMHSMRLWIIRHAKSSWAQPQQTDFERDLNQRGRRDGQAMSDWLSQQQNQPTLVWTSDAVRAQATTNFVAQGLSLTANQVHASRDLYHAAPEGIAGVLQQTPNDNPCVAVVAHNPGLTYLVNLLVGRQVTDNLPTFGVVELVLPSSYGEDWVNFRLPTSGDAASYATLAQFQSPKGLGA